MHDPMIEEYLSILAPYEDMSDLEVRMMKGEDIREELCDRIDAHLDLEWMREEIGL